jgi:hypothetical protein
MCGLYVMAGLVRRAVRVTRDDGRVVPANLGLCQCGSEQFVLFQLVEQTHLHVQCVACGVTYCPQGGGCHDDAGPDVDVGGAVGRG